MKRITATRENHQPRQVGLLKVGLRDPLFSCYFPHHTICLIEPISLLYNVSFNFNFLISPYLLPSRPSSCAQTFQRGKCDNFYFSLSIQVLLKINVPIRAEMLFSKKLTNDQKTRKFLFH